MPVEARTLRALLRLEADKSAISATVDDVERVEQSVEDLDAKIQKLNIGQRVQGGVGQALGRVPGFDPLGKLTDQTKDRLEFLGDGFEQLIDTMEDLGIELDGVAKRGLRAATSLSRINTDPIGAAVNAVGQMIGAIQDFAKGVEEGQEKVSSAWDKRLNQSFDSAVDAADDYVAAQQRIIDILRKFPIIGRLFVDAEEAVNASSVKIQRTLIKSATDYDDYVAAVQKMNANLGDWAHAIELLDQAQFDHRKELDRHRAAIDEVMTAYERGTATLEQVRDRLLDLGTVEAGLKALGAQIQIIDQQAANFKELGVAYREWQEGLAQAEQEWLDKRTAAQDEFNAEAERLEEELGAERQAAIERYGDDVAALEARNADERRALMENFIAQSNAAEEAYYAQRAKLAENYGIQAARAEEDHQRRMQRMREDAAIREQGLIESRDALGLVRARRDAERERRRADEDFSVQQARRSEDYARQLAEMQRAFEQQQAQRQQEYNAQLAALSQAYDEQQAALEEAKRKEQQTASDHYSEALDDLRGKFDQEKRTINQGYTDEQNRLNGAWDQRRQNLGFYLTGEAEMLASYYTTTENMLRDWIQRVQAEFRTGLPTFNLQGQQSGGYVGAGLYRVGEAGREFVMSNPTTQAAERLAGRPLTQAGILGAMGGNRTFQLSQTVHISDARDPQAVAAIVRTETLRAVGELLENVH
jgi:hypothetical protein